jgi:4-diphosphocytidyl-2-C-methyl-D-erythritol kinase
MRTEAFAAAKVNLCLHVTGRRPDGYHELDGLVVFAGVGDRLVAERAPDLTLEVEGPEAEAVPAGLDNLVWKAATAIGVPARLVLTKVLPVASGIGGGSADAAAALRALAALGGRPLPGSPALMALGADVPVCLAGRPARMRGAGERLDPLPRLPPLWLVLANPRVAVATGTVFAGLARRDHPPVTDLPAGWPDVAAVAAYLRAQRNDLAPAAEALAPVIGRVRAALAAQPGCLMARMSGSGATCFGLFAAEGPAGAAAAALRRAEPGWWVAAAPVLA